MQGNSTFVVAMDQYWNSTDENYQQDVEDGGPDPGNITAFNMTHSDTSAQGNLGNLTMEMIMPIDSGELEDGPLLDPYTNISIDYAAWVNMKDFDWMEDLGEYRTTQFYGSTSNTYLNFDDATNFYPLNPNDLLSTNLEQNFNINGTITDLEKPDCNHVLFSSVDVYRVGYMGTYTIDIYAANNDTMLYMGIIIPDVPYWADVDLNSAWDQQAPGNLTGITVQFDNNDDDVIEIEKDWKILTFDMILPFELVGFLAKVSKALADEKISIFVISAYSTDHILVKEEDLTRTKEKLKNLGFIIEEK